MQTYNKELALSVENNKERAQRYPLKVANFTRLPIRIPTFRQFYCNYPQLSLEHHAI